MKNNPAVAVLAIPVCMIIGMIMGMFIGNTQGAQDVGISTGLFLGGTIGTFIFGYLYYSMRARLQAQGLPLPASANYVPVIAGICLIAAGILLMFFV